MNNLHEEFYFIKDENDKIMISTAFFAVNQLELWDYMQSHNGSFMYSSNNNLDRIYKKIEDLGYCGHSGASFAMTLQNIKFIADYGFEEFKQLYTKEKK
jgi:hypothetical protein